jgi:hypothetical protein
MREREREMRERDMRDAIESILIKKDEAAWVRSRFLLSIPVLNLIVRN